MAWTSTTVRELPLRQWNPDWGGCSTARRPVGAVVPSFLTSLARVKFLHETPISSVEGWWMGSRRQMTARYGHGVRRAAKEIERAGVLILAAPWLDQRSSPNRKIEIAIIANMKFGIHAATGAGKSAERPSADVIPSAVQYAKPIMIASPKLRPRLRLRGSGSRLSDIPSATIITHASGIAYFKSRSTT